MVGCGNDIKQVTPARIELATLSLEGGQRAQEIG